MPEYDEMVSRYYDVDMVGVNGDVGFYVEEAAKAGSPVLEIGCGTGRITIPIAEAGIRLVGLDFSPAMLDIARRKIGALPDEVGTRIELVEGDMRGFPLGRRFSMVAIPYRAFLHNLTVDDQKSTLRCARERLNDGGKLVLDVFDPRLDFISAHVGDAPTPLSRSESIHPDTGHRVVRSIQAFYELGNQIARCELAYEELDDQGEVISRNRSQITMRWVCRHEMEDLLGLCGFEIESLYGDFSRGPFSPGGEQVWVCRRTG